MKLKRPLHGSETGADVRMVQRALNKAPSRTTIAVTSEYDETTQRRVRAFRMAHSLSPGKHVDQLLLDRLWPYFDAYGRWSYRRYKAPPKKPKLVEPKQGFSSLHRSLWEPYTIAVQSIGGYDLGTYNPASTLPGGGKSDHAVYPAMAFDIGFRPWTGWLNPLARRGFWKMADHPAVEYVILGDKIHTKTGGLHRYYSGGHMNHVHVSGRR